MAENLPPWSPASGGAFCPDWPQATRPRIPWLSSPSAIKICDSFLRRSSRTALLSRDEVANLLENVACISELRQPSGTRKHLAEAAIVIDDLAVRLKWPNRKRIYSRRKGRRASCASASRG